VTSEQPSHRQLRIQAGAELRTSLLAWLETVQGTLTDTEIAGIIQAQAHSLADQFMHARILADDEKRNAEQSERPHP
jgi:hypothetical protein